MGIPVVPSATAILVGFFSLVPVGQDDFMEKVRRMAEVECVDDLVKESGKAGAEGDVALWLLSRFQEPRAVPLLAGRIRRESGAQERKTWIQRLRETGLREGRAALETLAGEIADGEIRDLLREKAGEIRPPPEDPYLLEGGTAIRDPKMKEIFFRNLGLTFGMDVSYDHVKKSIFLSSTREDIPRLRQLRSRILFRFSDEGMHDYAEITKIIHCLRWQP